MHQSIRWVALMMSAAAAFGTLGCRADDVANAAPSEPEALFAPAPRIPVGTLLVVRLSHALSSESVAIGDPWRGVTTMQVLANDRVLVAQGAEVSGTVVGVRSARNGDPSMLQLCVRSILVQGRSVRLDASAQPIEAGTQVVLKEGTAMFFTANDAVAMR